MKRQLTLEQYRGIDLTLLTVFLLLSEAVIHAAIRWFPNELYTVSVVAAIVAIVLMRWGRFAAVPAFLGGAIFCVLSHATGKQYIIYCVGNLFALLSLLLFKVWDKEKIRTDSSRSLIFAGCTQLFMWLGRALVALVLGSEPGACLGFITTDALSGVFTLVIVWIARRLDGIFEDQKHYLLRIHEAEGEEKGGSQ